MKRLLIALAATTVLAAGGVASAHDFPGQNEGGYDQDEDWNNGGSDYSQFQQEYDHITQGIQHGLSDGSYTRYQAAQYYRELQNIRRWAYYQQENGDYDSGQTQARLERLHERMHRAHARGHQRQREGYGQYNRYGYGQTYQYGHRDGYDPYNH